MKQSCDAGEVQMGMARQQKRKRSLVYRTFSFGWSIIVLLIFIVVGFQIGGFVRFIYIVTAPPKPFEEKAGGIVALTGGAKRIETALLLLSKGASDRVLITGVNPDLSEESLIKLAKADASLFECCVDVDREAVDTIDNANEARKWAEANDIKSLIVVTGAFHMPRAMLEFSHAMDGIKLMAYPVNVPDRQDWWREGSRLRDLVREYGKLAFVRIRDRVNAFSGQAWPAMLLRERKE